MAKRRWVGRGCGALRSKQTPRTAKIGKNEKKRTRLLKVYPYCHYCRCPLKFETATIDHVWPKSRGGKSHMGNLVLACERCNREKGSKTKWTYKPPLVV